MYKVIYKVYHNGEYIKEDIFYTLSELNAHKLIQKWNNSSQPNKIHHWIYTVKSVEKEFVSKEELNNLVQLQDSGIEFYSIIQPYKI